ncbi:MAG: FAD-dependent oxidoreductase [Anaerolineae bacterium]|nr:FAD-dependent oxidoreductase [Anaerolineae bacterium]
MIDIRPTDRYDLAIIGAGSAGLTAAQAALPLGVRVALIEGKRTGGECTWSGCVPSKALLTAAKIAHDARSAADWGVQTGEVCIDFAAMMRRVHSIIYEIYDEESPDALRKKGMDVFEAYAQFVDPHLLALSTGERLRAKRIIIATGARPHIPDGFAEVAYLTNETLFELETLPDHLIIVGAGQAGVEMAQAFRRLGARVTLIGRAAQILPHDDEAASALLTIILRNEGVAIHTGIAALGAVQDGERIRVQLDNGETVEGDRLFVATGKLPNLEHLHLEAAGVSLENGRLVLDDFLRTSQRHILAAGDVTGGPNHTHYAGWQAFQAVRNALLPALRGKGVRAITPRATFTDPEVAQAGLTEADARAHHGDAMLVTHLPMTRADRAMTAGDAAGFMKLVHLANGRLLGATIVGWNAGEMINDWQAIIEKRGRILDTASVMRVYPTLGTTNVILATEQINHQLADGFLGKALRLLVRLSN